MTTRRALLGAIAAAPALSLAGPARAQFNRPLRLVVPFAPGGTSDILARLMSPKLTEALGQNVVVENKPGANGNIGADFVARAQPDGHTLLLTDVGSLATAPALFSKLSFDVTKDLAPVTMVLFAPYIMALHPSVPATTVAELVAYAKANPDKLNVAHSGVGAANHLTAILFARHFGITWSYVPYRGGAAAIRAVAQNECQVLLNGATATQPFVVQGQMTGIAVSGTPRLAALPGTPSFGEMRLPPALVDSGTWQGIVTTGGTPPATVAALSAAFSRVLAHPDIAPKIVELGGVNRAEGPAAFSAWMNDAIRSWGDVVRAERIVLD
jgi:tripartite-type tricarboxylate transporter receptor subunit TctC